MHTEHTNSTDASNNELKQITQIIFLATILKNIWITKYHKLSNVQNVPVYMWFFIKLCTWGQWNICVHVTIFDLAYTLYIL